MILKIFKSLMFIYEVQQVGGLQKCKPPIFLKP
nr:MAG TPA: hypothetical protein [Caudoviricetes sp.]